MSVVHVRVFSTWDVLGMCAPVCIDCFERRGGVLALGSADLFLDDCFGIPAGREDLTERSKV